MKSWRLISSPPSDGPSNMALDEALFNLHTPPTLRFYSWCRPILSIGRFQKIEDEFAEKCRDSGVDIVRRVTGGRAVLHQNEITYSFSSFYDDFPGTGTLSSTYNSLAKWLTESLSDLGLIASMSDKRGRSDNYTERDACFQSSTPYEIMVAGKKICGNAQKRGKERFMQHGSILMDMDDDLYLTIFGAKASDSIKFTTLAREGCLLQKDEIINIMIKRFESMFSCKLEETDIAKVEKVEQERLKSRYLEFMS